MRMNIDDNTILLKPQSGFMKETSKKKSRIPVKCRQRNRFIPAFLAGVVILSVLSLFYLEIDWMKMLSRVPDIGEVFWELGHLDFSNMDLILSSLVETISIAVLSLLYSLILGIVFGMLAARNILSGSAAVLPDAVFLHLPAGGSHACLGVADAGLLRDGTGGRRGGPVRAYDGVFHEVLRPEL